MYDWPDAAHFGEKAVAAAAGHAVQPERPADWRLPAARIGEITAAGARLGAVFERGARQNLPSLAARAQARFDCWLEQQEENWQTDHIARCRGGFLDALAELEGALPPLAKSPLPAAALPAAHAAPEPAKASEPVAFTVLFEFDSDTLDGESAAAAVGAMVEAARAGRTVRVIINGHADRAGTDAYNRGLSLSRADAVRARLLARGIPADHISVNAFGESRPRVGTPDGVREPRNRRVEVTVGPAPAL